MCHLTDFSVYSLIQLELSLRQLQSNIILLLEFVLDVDFSLFTCGELDKEERKARVWEEALFSPLAVLVHRVSDEHEVNLSAASGTLDVSLLEVVAQHNGKQAGGKLEKLGGGHLDWMLHVEQIEGEK